MNDRRNGTIEDILEIIHAPFGDIKLPLTKGSPHSVEREHVLELGELFHSESIQGRYSVFQLIGRQVIKKDDVFVLSPGNWAYDPDKDIAKNFLQAHLGDQINKIMERSLQLERVRRGDAPRIGVVSLYIDETIGGNTQLFIFGSFSAESSDPAMGRGQRGNVDNSIYLELSGKQPNAIASLLAQLDDKDKSNDSSVSNRAKLVEAIGRVFPAEVMNKVHSHTFPGLEVLNIIDKRP